VPDADAAVRTVEAAGGKVPVAPVDTEFGRLAVLGDPWGAAFSVMQDPPA
jgi:predicted enzyme related to lactoylglutathione lyase